MSRMEITSQPPLNQVSNLRMRSESHYLPGSSCQQRDLTLRSPLQTRQLSPPHDQLNSTYYQRMAPSSSSQQFLGQYQSLAHDSSQLFPGFNVCQQLRPLIHINSATAKSAAAFSQSVDFHRGFFTALASPTFGPAQPVGRKAKPEVTELIERQKSRINSQTRRGCDTVFESFSNF